MPLMFGSRKIKVTKEEFAELLCLWFSRQVNREAIEQSAKILELKDKEDIDSSEPKELFGLNLKNKKDFTVLAEELISLNMWLIVRACERVFKDTDKRNECLDIFHRIVYERFIEEPGENIKEWVLPLYEKYVGYANATETEHQLGPAWELSKLINENLHGKVLPDAFIQFQISTYITSSIEALEGLLQKYKVK